MPRFVIYDTRHYILEAEDEDAAFNMFCDMTQEQANQLEVEGGHIEVEPSDV